MTCTGRAANLAALLSVYLSGAACQTPGETSRAGAGQVAEQVSLSSEESAVAISALKKLSIEPKTAEGGLTYKARTVRCFIPLQEEAKVSCSVLVDRYGNHQSLPTEDSARLASVMMRKGARLRGEQFVAAGTNLLANELSCHSRAEANSVCTFTKSTQVTPDDLTSR